MCSNYLSSIITVTEYVLIRKLAAVIWPQSRILRALFSCLFHIYFFVANLCHLRRFAAGVRLPIVSSFQSKA